jgi:hypothetical protein
MELVHQHDIHAKSLNKNPGTGTEIGSVPVPG